METKDLLITPIYFILLLGAAYMMRSSMTNTATRKYFIPAITLKFIGAITLGMIYQFYYGGGDTFTYHTYGSKWIWEAMMDSPSQGIKLFFLKGGIREADLYYYTSKIWMFRDSHSYFVIKIAAFFDLFTFHTYSATALFFAAFAFSGHWVLFITFQKLYPSQTRNIAIATLFIPSIIFWGSGLLKDSITLASLCWITYALFQITLWKKGVLINMLLIVFFSWIIFSIKIYILLSFLIAASVFLYKHYSGSIRNTLIRILAAPFFALIFLVGGYFTIQKISEGDSRYALDKIGQTAQITAYDIRYGWGARHGDNSGYTLGELDGSIGSVIALAPKGLIVTLFRPWPWEVKNPLMLMSAAESLALLLITLYILLNIKLRIIWERLNHPVVLFCITFSIIFAVAVGASTFNFGSLARYKIPVLPFYAMSLIFLLNDKKE